MSADHSTIACGHAAGHIFTWEIARPGKPFLHIPPIDRKQTPKADGHCSENAVLHLGFLGTRHTALVSADEKGMAFSHLATRGMGAVLRSVRTSRILGRYADTIPGVTRSRKPSSVLAFSPLPLGNAEHTSDSMGLVAMLTPYLLVIVSTLPIPQTQHKTPRPKEVAAHSTMSAALAWFPSLRLKYPATNAKEASSKVKLVYSWSNILTILEVVDVEPSEPNEKGAVATLDFRLRSRWKAEEAIVGLQWLGPSVVAVLTISQQLLILKGDSLEATDSADLIQKHLYHVDLFSQQLHQLVEHLDEEDESMHGVVADAFYMSFRAYKGRLFILGFNEISLGTLSNWADRLYALVQQWNFIEAIRLATTYYIGTAPTATVGLPEDDVLRHKVVQEYILKIILSSLKYAFEKNEEARASRVDDSQLEELADVCINACISMADLDFLFEEVYNWFQDNNVSGIFIDLLEPRIMEGEVQVVPPTVIKDLIHHYMAEGRQNLLEEIICNLDPRTMDIDQVTALCKKHYLYDALLYVWNEALGDYTSILSFLLDLASQTNGTPADPMQSSDIRPSHALKLFPYMSYILTSRIYPTGKEMLEEKALLAKAEIYQFFFSPSSHRRFQGNDPNQIDTLRDSSPFPNLRKILDFDAPSFLSMLNEAFEDSFLNDGDYPQAIESQAGIITKDHSFGFVVNRWIILKTLRAVMAAPKYSPEDIIYLYMFTARNLPKFPQSLLRLPENELNRVLIGLCNYPGEELGEDCQLSVEYLLSIHQPHNLPALIPLIKNARFYRVLKSIYKTDRQFAKLLQTCVDDYDNPDAIFDCIGDCLRPGAGLTESQTSDFRAVLADHAYDIVSADVAKTAQTVQLFASDLHGRFLDALDADEYGQFRYLRTVLEPGSRSTMEDQVGRYPSLSRFIAPYVRLLCVFEPHHVSEFIEQLKPGDLQLEEVLPALENSGIIDGAVVLMAREGQVLKAMNRLTKHLRTLEAALLGLLEGLSNSPDFENALEAAHDLVSSIQKYSRVGVWLCQGHVKTALLGETRLRLAQYPQPRGEELSPEERLWLELIDAVVGVAKTATEELDEIPGDHGDDHGTVYPEISAPSPRISELVTDLRLIVQEVFTALLAITSAPRAKSIRRTQVSFLRILRAFLSRASSSAPSLSNLRAVLTTIFSAYAHEESLLSLANRLLDKDLFVHVAEVNSLRKRGWRPLGQVCEGCGRKVWGPGAGGHIWDAWKERHNQDFRRAQEMNGGPVVHPGPSSADRHWKGKSTATDALEEADSVHGEGSVDDKNGLAVPTDHEDGAKVTSGALVVFSCRHLFHKACLETMQGMNDSSGSPGVRGWSGAGAGAGTGVGGGTGTGASHDHMQPTLWCPLCS